MGEGFYLRFHKGKRLVQITSLIRIKQSPVPFLSPCLQHLLVPPPPENVKNVKDVAHGELAKKEKKRSPIPPLTDREEAETLGCLDLQVLGPSALEQVLKDFTPPFAVKFLSRQPEPRKTSGVGTREAGCLLPMRNAQDFFSLQENQGDT